MNTERTEYDHITVSPPFTWVGQTLRFKCCKHEYKDHIIPNGGIRTCLLCWSELGSYYYEGIPKPIKTVKPRIPKIRLSDENGKQKRVKYH